MAAKYKPKRMGVTEAKKLGVKCVYVMLDGNLPVYVGKTNNTNKRFESYLSGSCHNVALSEWINLKGRIFDVEIYECDNISELEVFLIRKHKDSLFNISNGKEADWYKQSSNKKPWVAGTGIFCPSTMISKMTKSSKKKSTIKSFIGKLTDKERCSLEVELAIKLGERCDKWLSITSDKLIYCLES